MSSCWTMSPNRSSVASGSRGTRTHKRDAPAACFQDRFLIQPDDFRIQVAGVGIEPTPPGSEPSVTASSNYPARRSRAKGQESRAGQEVHIIISGSRLSTLDSRLSTLRSRLNCGGRNRTCGLVVQSHEFLPTETTPQCEEGRVGLEPTRGCLTDTCSAAELPTRIRGLPRFACILPIGRRRTLLLFSLEG